MAVSKTVLHQNMPAPGRVIVGVNCVREQACTCLHVAQPCKPCKHITMQQSFACCTLQALVYFAVSKKGETPIDGKTDANPEGLTAVTGKHAQAFADRLAAGDLSCKVDPRQDHKQG